MRIFLIISILMFQGFTLGASAKDGETFSSVYKEYNQLVGQKRFVVAEEYALKAYELGKKKFGEGAAETFVLAYNVGFVLNQNREYKKAIPYLNEGLEGLKSIHSKEGIELLDSYIELGKANLGVGKDRNAKINFGLGLKTIEAEYGPNAPLAVDVNIEIGNYYLNLADADAVDFYKAAYEAGKEAFPQGDYRTGIAAFSLGKMYQAKKLKKKAEKLFLETLEIYEMAPPPDIEFLMVAHTFLVQLYSEMGDDDRAVEHCVQVGHLRGDVDVDSARPLYKMRPYYPKDAMYDGKEGMVRVEYSVGPDGKVYNPRVMESSSKSFSKMAIETIQQWRYAPKVVDGEPVPTDGLQYIIHFSFAEDS